MENGDFAVPRPGGKAEIVAGEESSEMEKIVQEWGGSIRVCLNLTS